MNKLNLNTSKIEVMVETTKFKCYQLNMNINNVQVGKEKIDLVEEIKYLGYIIENINHQYI